MIIRQLCVRHGRSALKRSSKLQRSISDIGRNDRMFQQSTTDRKAGQRIPGHPSDEESSILDTSPYPPTVRARNIAQAMDALQEDQDILNAQVSAHTSSKTSIDPSFSPPSQPETTLPTAHDTEYNTWRQLSDDRQRVANQGTDLSEIYGPHDLVVKPVRAQDLTLPMLLANQTHLGHATSLWNPSNSSYIFGMRDGIHIISLDVTFAYLRRAAKVVQEVARRGGIILFVGTRDRQEDIVVNSAKLAQGYHIFDRWIPGLLSNGQAILGDCAVKVVNMCDEELSEYRPLLSQRKHTVMRPDLVICLNPLENEVCLHECGLYNVPTIGIIDTDANPTWVTYPIPANDDSLRSVALVAGVLGKAGQEGQRLRQQAALQGRTTYPANYASRTLERIEVLASMNVGETDIGDSKGE